MPRIKATAILLSLATLSVPAFAQGTDPAVRDSSSALNYVQGQVTLDGQPVTTPTSGTPRALHAGQVLATTNGSADVRLVPGSLLRIGQGTTVNMVAASENRAEVRIESGRANVAVNMLSRKGLVLIDLPNGQTQIRERGLYTFDTGTGTVRVFDGRADVFPGANTDTNEKPVKVKDEHAFVLSDPGVKPSKFDRTESQSELLPWTGPAEAHADGEYGLSVQAENNDEGGYAPATYGYGVGPSAFGYGYSGYGDGFGYPYGLYGYPYGFYGYPGLGVGFGYGYGGYGSYGGFYPGGYRGGYGGGYGGGYPIHGTGVAGHAGGYAGGGSRSGVGGSHTFTSGGFHGGGGGGGFRGGGGHR